jgi:hypothetical protein
MDQCQLLLLLLVVEGVSVLAQLHGGRSCWRCVRHSNGREGFPLICMY